MKEFLSISKTSSDRMLDASAAFCAQLTDGDEVFAQSNGSSWCWSARFPKATATDNKTTCRPIAWGPSAGSSTGPDGAFVRTQDPQPGVMEQTTWIIDEANSTGLADDENDGLTASTPLATAAERRRRMGISPQWKASTAYHLRYLSTCAAEVLDGELADGNTTIYLHGSMTDRAGDLLFSGVFTAVDTLNTATNTPWASTSASIPSSWTAAGLLNKRIRVTSGTNINAISWVTLDQGGAAPAAKARFAEFLTPVASFSVAPFAAPATNTAGPSNGDTFVVEDLRTITSLYIRVRRPVSGVTVTRVVLDSLVTTIQESPNIGIYSDGSQISTGFGLFALHSIHQCRLVTLSDWGFKAISGGYTINASSLNHRSSSAGTFTRFTIQGNVGIVTLGGGSTDGGLGFVVGQVGIFDTTNPSLLLAGVGNRIQNTTLYGSGNTAAILRLTQGARIVLTSFTATPVVTTSTQHVALGSGPPFRVTAPALDESGGTPVWTALRNLTFTTIMQTVAAGGFGPLWTDPVSGAGWSN